MQKWKISNSVKSRKLYIWIISLGVVLTVYLLYNLISKTPLYDIDSEYQLKEQLADSNIGWTGGEVGKIGDIGISTVQKFRYMHRNENKEVDREFGFEELLREEADQWEIKKPFMNIYQDSFKCYVIADRGTVQVETALGRPTPADATFTGNVVIHILPQTGSDVKESFIYLDDIVFISERSLFSTAGPVKFVSQDARMLGTGLQLVYNNELERLEFLRLKHLESLRLKSSQTGFFSSAKPQAEKPADVAARAQTEKLKETAAADQYYKCVFGKNVIIDTPEQIIFAEDEVSINHIFWAKGSSSEPPEADTSSTNAISESSVTVKPDEPNKVSEQADIILTCDAGVIVAPMNTIQAFETPVDISDNSVSKKLSDSKGRAAFTARRIDYDASTGDTIAPGASQLTFFTGGVTASDVNASAADANAAPVPVIITAQKQTRFLQASNQVIFEGDCLCTMPQKVAGGKQNGTLSSPMFTMNMPEDKSRQSFASVDITAAGPAELNFYVDDLVAAAPEKTVLPVKVTAQRQISFLSKSKQVIFEGDCMCSVLRKEPKLRQKYVLLAPKLTINLPKDTNDSSTALATDIEHLTADGGLVRLATTTTTAGEKLLSGIELKCRRFDYDPNQQLFLAAGPGVIKFNNSKVPDKKEKLSGFSLRKPCWAVVEDFDSLRYFPEPNRIVADAGSEELLISYFPIINGEFGQRVEARAGFVEAFLYRTINGQTELATLTAEKGITYEDEDNEFHGSNLFYDHKKTMMYINGNESHPGNLNGALVDNIEYNLKTGRIKANIAGPSALQLK